MQINFGGFNPQQMQQIQEVMSTCQQHPGCIDCPYNNLQGLNGTICETAMWRLQNDGVSNESV